MRQAHNYNLRLEWTGARQGPVESYAGYSREYTVTIAGKPALIGSADPTYRGDPKLHNPEDMLLAALVSCHMLSYLALCALAKIPVIAYSDEATGKMEAKGPNRIGFTDALLRPRVVIAAGADRARAEALHDEAHAQCFIANSVNFPVRHAAEIVIDDR